MLRMRTNVRDSRKSKNKTLFPAAVFQTLATQVEGHRRPLAGPFHAHEGPYVPPAMLLGRPLGCQLDPG